MIKLMDDIIEQMLSSYIYRILLLINKRINLIMKGHQKDRRDARSQDTLVSKSLSFVLRHGALEEGLTIDAGGFVPLQQVMQFLRRKGHKNIDQNRIRKIVDGNDKKRFQIQERKHHVFIRATQGHSMKIVETEELLTKLQDPTIYPVVIHGTFMKFWHLIKAQGLKRMNRNHIHFAPGLPKEQGVISGMRGSCDIIVQIDMESAMKDGIAFYISSNNVILTEGVDGLLASKYFKNVFKKDGTPLLQEKQQQKVQKVLQKQVIETLPFKKKIQE